jgi:hypothetical protein
VAAPRVEGDAPRDATTSSWRLEGGAGGARSSSRFGVAERRARGIIDVAGNSPAATATTSNNSNSSSTSIRSRESCEGGRSGGGESRSSGCACCSGCSHCCSAGSSCGRGTGGCVRGLLWRHRTSCVCLITAPAGVWALARPTRVVCVHVHVHDQVSHDLDGLSG